MESHHLINGAVFLSIFFVITSIVQILSKKVTVPYTVLLLIAGFAAQLVSHQLHLESEIKLEPNFIYYILLPLLLFESAMHINIHQFRLQFWTITFMSTFGLLVSLFVVAFGITWVLGLPIEVGLLFGALISATDPIAVLTIFKSLGAPKRLALIADGESMFNDATAVIAYKVVAGFIFASTYFNSDRVFTSLGSFLYSFLGSILVGAVAGYLFSKLIKKVHEDAFVEASLTVTLALGSFILADHYMGMSGVITTVMAAIVMGNLGRIHISKGSKKFINETWEYIAFISVSLVFFFAAFQLDIKLIMEQMGVLHAVIMIVLISRAISVYLSFFITNKLSLFKNEPDVPVSWQHILNWGGLRGVIPLVLAYSIPETFEYRDDIISFTLATFVFTLLINGLTIRKLLVLLKLHLPKKEEEIIKEENNIYDLENKIHSIEKLPKIEFNDNVLKKFKKELKKHIEEKKQYLSRISSKKEINEAVRLQAISISRKVLLNLYFRGYISTAVFQEYEAQLDLQQDAIEYPDVYYGRGYSKGRVPNQKLFRQRIQLLNKLIRNFPILKSFIGIGEKEIVCERLMVLKAKIICAQEIIKYTSRFIMLFSSNKETKDVLIEVETDYQERKTGYESELAYLNSNYHQIAQDYQLKLLKNFSD